MSCKKLLKASVLLTFLLLSHLSYSQDKVISGKVTDPKDGSGVAGVNVSKANQVVEATPLHSITHLNRLGTQDNEAFPNGQHQKRPCLSGPSTSHCGGRTMTHSRAYRTFNVESVDRLWKLEQEIRAWRRDREDIYLKYEDMEIRLVRWLRRGWLKPSELSGLDEDRLGRIQRRA